ncbi:hypothetical protein [Haloglomus halophilum]|uniref:hypothetical protein n=1 Tax=Haloglomus halophilum TaxID=2962672 RepID=UPI0020C95F09|nr:hypothetical protein [Haloglomus halophilum]
MSQNDLIEEFTELYPTGLETVSRPTESRLYHGADAETPVTGTWPLDPWSAEAVDGFRTARLNYDAVARVHPQLASRLREDPATTISMARLAYQVFTDREGAGRLIEATNFEVYQGPSVGGQFGAVSPERLCRLEGVVQEASRVELSLYEAAMRCEDCGSEQLISIGTLDEGPPDIGPCTACTADDPWQFEPEHSLYRPIQTARLERPTDGEESAPAASVPIVLADHLALGVVEGDEAAVTGIRCERPDTQSPLTISGPYLHCSSIESLAAPGTSLPFEGGRS